MMLENLKGFIGYFALLDSVSSPVLFLASQASQDKRIDFARGELEYFYLVVVCIGDKHSISYNNESSRFAELSHRRVSIDIALFA